MLTVEIKCKRRWWVRGSLAALAILIAVADELAGIIVRHGIKTTVK